MLRPGGSKGQDKGPSADSAAALEHYKAELKAAQQQYMKFKKFTGIHTIEESRTTFHTSFLQRSVVSSSTALVLKSSQLTVERKAYSVTTE